MKRNYFILLLLACVAGSVCGQTPDAFQYQAVIAGDNGAALVEKDVKVRFNIRENTATGTVVYSETHQAKTNAAGMVFLRIGKGFSESEILFANINWAKGACFIETEVDKGNGYVNAGTQQFLCVPYAKYADNAGTLIMTSSGGKKWAVTINEDGAISTQEITEQP
ncbi:MAG: hypothetical protein LBH61_04600 [Dysgonamonadaceae bacterium]|jgi:hypothetical protein|nr:hypothetical protein [Dysgonamonadaceae bacterium]